MYMKNGKTKNGGMVLKSRLLLKGTGQPTEYVVFTLSLWQMSSQVSPHSGSESNLTNWCTFYISENWYFLSVFPVQNIALYATNGRHYAVCTIPFPIHIRFSRVLSLSPSLIELICLCKATSTSTIFEFINHVLNFSGFTLFWIYCRKNVIIRFARRTDIMPPVPLETKYHPSAVDILLIKRLITETSKQTLLQFLQHEFVNIGKSHAERLIGENLKLIAFIYLRSLVKTKLVGSQGCLAKDYVHALCIVDNGK